MDNHIEENNNYIIDNVDVRLINQPIIHKELDNYKIASTKLEYIMNNNINKNAFQKPKDLLIVIVSNYTFKTLAEKSLDYHGIEYVKLDGNGKKFENMLSKLIWISEYLENNVDNINEKYLLYFDSRDAIIQDDPQKILDIYLSKKCKLLFSGTEYNCDFVNSKKIHHYNPQVKNILNKINHKNPGMALFQYSFKRAGNNTVFLNSGGFIGEINFMRETFKYILSDMAKLGHLSNFHKDDQVLIHNYLPLYSNDEIQIDIYFEIFWRNTFRKNYKVYWNPGHIPPYQPGKSFKLV
jgi:hypothetical protein